MWDYLNSMDINLSIKQAFKVFNFVHEMGFEIVEKHAL